MRTRNPGFTLIELLIATAVMAILTALASASYTTVKSRWDAEEARAALYTGFFTAKTQALAGGIQTVICPSTDGQYCLASNQWHHGWIVFQDLNQNREHGTTLVLVTHNVFQAHRMAQRIAFLLEGKLVEVADTETFFNNPIDPRTAAFTRGEMVY